MEQLQDQEQNVDVRRVVLRVVEDFGSESTLMFVSGVMAWIIAWPPDVVYNLPFYQALTGVAPAIVWSSCWWVLTFLVLLSLALQKRHLRTVVMALLLFSWSFTGVVLSTATNPVSILAPFAFVFAASALQAWWRLAIRAARADHA